MRVVFLLLKYFIVIMLRSFLLNPYISSWGLHCYDGPSYFCSFTCHLCKIIGVVFATEIFARFTPLVDSQLYLQGAAPDLRDLRTLVPNEFGSFLNEAGGPFFAHTMFALFL